jgi:NTP pyrophosphatase (non-canonical NTP hydrolase)
MELEKMINETQELSQRLHAVIGPWDGILLVTHLAAVVGRLADDVMTIEGKLAMPLEHVRFARTIADALLQLIRISNMYHIDLERAWTELLEEARSGLSNEEFVARMSGTIRQNQERRQQG